MKIDWTFILSAAAGAAAGALATLLYAPSSGVELRQNISDHFSDSVEYVSRGLENTTTTYTKTYKTAGTQIERLFAAVSAGVEEARRTRGEMELIPGELDDIDG